jgi:N-acetylmuramoyl-L-alanine amidase
MLFLKEWMFRNKITVLLIVASLLVSSTTVLANGISIDGKAISLKTIMNHYQIVKGDSLWRISRKFGVTIDELREANGLKGDIIHIGKELKIPEAYYFIGDEMVKASGNRVNSKVMTAKVSTPEPKTVGKNKVIAASVSSPKIEVKVSETDRYWLAKVIEAEAGTESLKGKIAVGAVVLNRVEDSWFPDTIRGVIFQRYRGVYQFSPVGDGRIYKIEPSKDAYEAADRALRGEDPTKEALFFYNPKISKSKFFAKKQALVTIGNHKFFD